MKGKVESAANRFTSFFSMTVNGSDTHLNAQRSNGVAEVLNASLQSLNSAAICGPKFAQLLIGFWIIAHPKTNFAEKCVGLLQLVIAGGQLGTAIAILFLDEQCTTSDSDLCKTALLLALLYQGLLLTGWVPSEASKIIANSTTTESLKATSLKNIAEASDDDVENRSPTLE